MDPYWTFLTLSVCLYMVCGIKSQWLTMGQLILYTETSHTLPYGLAPDNCLKTLLCIFIA